MAEVVSCPSAAELESYLKGRSTSDQLDAVARHIEECADCGATVDRLAKPDETLMDLMRASETAVGSAVKDQSVEELIEKLKQTPIPTGDGTQASLAPSKPVASPEMTSAESYDAGDPLEEIRQLLAPAQAPDEIGRLGAYRVLKVLGTGGMGVVFLAEDMHLRRFVALKAMRPEVAKRPTSKQRFLREAQAAAGIKHEHIVGIHAFGEERGVLFLAIEFLEGESLEDAVKRIGKFSVADVLRIGRETALGLSAAHKRNLVHRDIKPANLWLEGEAGKVKVLDFGLARGEQEEMQLTQSGMIIGTPAYMAPEQARGVKVDARCDLFSLGVVLYRMCAGELPFRADNTMGILTALALEDPKPIGKINPDLPKELAQLIMQLLAKKPEDRPASAQEVAERMAEIERSLAPQATMIAPAKPKPRAGWMVAVGLLLGIGGVALGVHQLIFRTPDGTLIVDVSKDADVRFKEGKLQVFDEDGKLRYTIGPSETNKTLPVGKYLISIVGSDGLKLDTDRFEMTRGTTRVRVTLDNSIAKNDGNANPVAVVDNKKTDPVILVRDKDKPFLLIRKSGEKVEAESMARAMAQVQDGDVIEIYGNGPFRVGEYRIKANKLTIRGAAGYRPQFRSEGEGSFLVMDGTAFTAEHCDFGSPVGWSLFEGSGPSWEFRNCRLIFAQGPLARYKGPKLTFRDCLIMAPSGPGPNWIDGELDRLELVNCVGRLSAPMFSFKPLGKAATIVLQGNTFTSTLNFFGNLDLAKDQRYIVEATGNVFERNQTSANLAYPANFSWKSKVEWNGSNNFYGQKPYESAVLLDKEGKKVETGFKGWNEFWGKPEAGSKEADRVHFGWRALEAGRSAQEMIAALKPTVEAMKGALPNAGPDWSLVGPGDAYLRALAAQGKAPSKDQIRPEPLEGGPITLIHGRAAKGFSRLGDAVAAAADGDTIEFRTDDTIREALPPAPKGVKSLTIKAAPGYLPVIDSEEFRVLPGATLNLEGLHFESGLLGANDGNPEKLLRLGRIANCSFAPHFKGGASHAQIGDALLPAESGTMEVVNCIAPGGVRIVLQPGGKLTIDNSILSTIWYAATEGKGTFRMEIRRSYLWYPTQSLPGCLFTGEGPKEKQSLIQPEIEMNDTIVDTASGFYLLYNRELWIENWKGDRNAYLVPEGIWFYQGHDGPQPKKMTTVVTSLAGLQRSWSSDAHSIQRDPVIYDAQSWRLLPNSPGQGFGADVKRIGIIPSATPAAPVQPEIAAGPVDKEKPFVLVRKSGEKVEVSTFARALQLHQDGDVIEVHGNGPFRASDMSADKKTLAIRAGKGYRPIIVTPIGKNLLRMNETTLEVEGCDFRSAAQGGGSMLFGGTGGNWMFTRCGFHLGAGEVASYTGPKLAFRDCMIVSGFGQWMAAATDRLELVNCVARVTGPLLNFQPHGPVAQVLLEKNTFFCSDDIFGNPDRWKDKRFIVKANGNAFENLNFLGLVRHPNEEHWAQWKTSFEWNGSDNFYVQHPIAAEVTLDKEGKKKVTGNESWALLRGKPESGSKEGTTILPQWRQMESAATLQAVIDAGKPTVDAAKSKLPNVGPDWSLMGPGEAYVKALAAQGKTAKDRLRSPPIEGAPFVVMHDEKVVKAFERFQEAVDNVAEGDAIEIRTDDPIAGLQHVVFPKRVKTICIRSAPGYLATADGDAHFITSGLTITIEGIRFQRGRLQLSNAGMEGNKGRLPRLVNCSIHSPHASEAVIMPDPSESGTMEIVNCLIPGLLSFRLQPNTKLTVDNSLIGGFFGLSAPEKGTHRLEIRRSCLWQGGLWVSRPQAFAFEEAPDTKGANYVRPDVSMSDTFVQNAAAFAIATQKTTLAGWKGERNAYRLPDAFWMSVHGANQPPVASFSDWQQKWGSDVGSNYGEPLIYNPQTWRLMPGSPGVGFGADVSKLK